MAGSLANNPAPVSQFGVALFQFRTRFLRRLQRGYSAVRELGAVRGLGVAFDFLQRLVAADRHDFMRRATGFGQTAAAGFAQAMRRASLGDTGLPRLIGEPL